MGQLLKMQDFVSRYETDLIRYTNQFIRLKKQQWEKFRENWENGPEEEEEAPAPVESRQVLSRMKHWLKRKDTAEIEEPDVPVFHAPPGELDFAPQLAFLPETEDQLKKLFLDQLFRFQLKWASSTLLQQSEIPAVLYFDPDLKYFLQRFPDTFLLMYRPVFSFKKAVLEMEHLLISPMAVWCITFVEKEKDAVFFGSNGRFWKKRTAGNEENILNPAIALARTEKIVRSILKRHDITFPVERALICRNGFIQWPDAPDGLHILDKRPHAEWFRHQRNLRSPFKYMQLKSAQVLLNECLDKNTSSGNNEAVRDGGE